jgi:hypothetical protein
MTPRLDPSERPGVVLTGRWATMVRDPNGTRSPRWVSVVAVIGLWLLGVGGGDPAATARAEQAGGGQEPGGIEFFEKAIRPVLARQCSACHGARIAKPKGGLILDGREAMLKGGDSGPAIVPGEPESSLLIQAVRYTDPALRMPPKGRLTPEEVAAFESWVKRGAPAPTTADPGASATARGPEGDPWAFHSPHEPAIPSRRGNASPIDAFLMVRLDKRDLKPAPLADRRTLIRRASFDLTGLPPAPEDVETFAADRSPDAFARVVDRLLASPRYGERWARHWLDLVRYTDEIEEAWRYRDWVVKAFNDDRPYNQFIVDQVAGDLIPAAAAAAAPDAVNVNGIVATTVLAIGPWGGIDRKKRLADIVDDQIDIVGRTFLGLTIACARCHNHKFDPIPTDDYYGLAGFFFSSRILSDTSYLSHTAPRLKVPLAPAAVVEEHRQMTASVRRAEDRLQAAVDHHYAAFARGLLPTVADYLLAAWDYSKRPADQAGLSAEDFASRRGLQGFALKRWIEMLEGPRVGETHALKHPVRDFDGERGVAAWKADAERPWWAYNATNQDVAIETFLLPPRSVSVNPGVEGGAVGWTSPVAGTVRIAGRLADGDPHDGSGVSWAIDHVRTDNRPRQLATGRLPNGGSMGLEQGRFAHRLGAVRVEVGDLIQLQVALAGGDAHYDITNVALTITASDGSAEWDLARDTRVNFLACNPHADALGRPGVWRFDDMAGSHRADRMPAIDRLLGEWDAATASGKGRSSVEAAAHSIGRTVAAAGQDEGVILDLTGPRSPFWVKDRDDAKYLPTAAQAELQKLATEIESLRTKVPAIAYASAIRDGGVRYGPYPGIADARIYVRGDYELPGRTVPRHFPTALGGSVTQTIGSGSGRPELARWLARPDNPLTARVMVNRIWQHHFGAGIVATPSNFGKMGRAPTHPELLDWLALRFIGSDWSIKQMHRMIMLSDAYQRSSRPTAALLEADPENHLWGRMERRPLAAEELHDGLLALAERLDERPGGPAESDASSPRRLIYLASSRGDRSDFGSMFDRANPALHVERRTASTVAPQALYLMNHPWVIELARGLARRPDVTAECDPARRMARLYQLIYGRCATSEEIDLGHGLLAQAATGADPQAVWDRYAQALLLTNEFLFLD